nr:ABC transporter permease [Dactylosporangium thailandense]
MTRYLLRRLLFAVPTLLGVSLVVFVTVKLIPGDPVSSLLGTNGTPQARAELTARLGLDRPPPVQYLTWLWNALRGDLGMSTATHGAVLGLVAMAFVNTLWLAAFAAILAVGAGAVLGAYGAFGRSRLGKALAEGFSIFGMSAPQYSLALVLLIVFAVGLHAFPVSGMYSPRGGGWGDLLWHLVLPGVAAALVPAGVIARMFRASLIELRSADWVDAYRWRGVSERRIRRHLLRNALAPFLTISGLQIGYLLGGVVFVETIFAWPGLGRLVFDSIAKRDLSVIQGGVLISALAFVLINIAVDAAVAIVDPRVRG